MKDNSNDCVDELMFEPSFVDKNQNPVTIEDKNNYKIVYGEPQCYAVQKYEGPSNRFVLSKYDFVAVTICEMYVRVFYRKKVPQIDPHETLWKQRHLRYERLRRR